MDSTFIRLLGAWFVNLIQVDVPFKNLKERVQKVRETFSVMRYGAMCVHTHHSDVYLKCTNILFSCYLTFVDDNKKLRKNNENVFGLA